MNKNRRKPTGVKFLIRYSLIVALVVYFAASIIGQQSELNSLNSIIADYNTKIDEKNSELAIIEDKKKNAASDELVESIARERLGLVRSDETVFVDITGK